MDSNTEFYETLLREVFKLPSLTGVKKKIMDNLRKNGAHFVFRGEQIENPFYLEVMREALSLYWLGVIPSCSMTLTR